MTERARRDRRLAGLTAVVVLSLVIANIGSISSAAIVREHPELLLALSSRNRHLLFAVGADIQPWAYAVIPFLRLIPIALAYFFLAYWYGERGKGWYEKEVGVVPKSIAWSERVFDRIGTVAIVIFAGSTIVWMLAGLRKVPPKRFVVLEVIGIACRLVVIWWLGNSFKSQLDTALEFRAAMAMAAHHRAVRQCDRAVGPHRPEAGIQTGGRTLGRTLNAAVRNG